MVYVSKPIVVAALIIAPAIAAPISDIAGSEEHYSREYEDADLEARGLRKVGSFAGKALDRAGTAASIVSLFRPPPQPRDLDFEELEAREPSRLARAGHIAGKALDRAGTVATIASLFRPQRRELDYEEFEAREPSRLGRAGHIAGKALDRAGTVANIVSIFRPQRRELEAREPAGTAWDLGKKMFLAGSAAATFGSTIGGVFKRPKSPEPAKRGFSEEDIFERDFNEDFFERDFEIDGDLFERSIDDEEFYARAFDELEERAINVQKVVEFVKKGAKYAVPAAGVAGFGLGVGAQVRSREFDEMYQREVGTTWDELD
ncbi:hypothetical protein MD484_g6424, partial [Candolleomyces efflorescens]